MPCLEVDQVRKVVLCLVSKWTRSGCLEVDQVRKIGSLGSIWRQGALAFFSDRWFFVLVYVGVFAHLLALGEL